MLATEYLIEPISGGGHGHVRLYWRHLFEVVVRGDRHGRTPPRVRWQVSTGWCCVDLQRFGDR